MNEISKLKLNVHRESQLVGCDNIKLEEWTHEGSLKGHPSRH